MQSNTQSNPKVRKGDRVRAFTVNGTLDSVVYTVDTVVRRGNAMLPVILDYWQPVVLTRWVKVP